MKVIIFVAALVMVFSTNTFAQEKKNIADVIEPIIKKDGAGAGIAEYKKLKASNSKDYNFDEKQLDGLGDKAAAADMDSVAMLLYKLNTDNFPKSANAHYKLGYSYMKNGRNSQALTSLQKSVSLNAGNAEAKAKIADLKNSKISFVCPPCYCSKHEIDFKMPGKCPHCKMNLIKKPTSTTTAKK